MNFLIIALAALVPLVMGFIWYNPRVFGNPWMKSAEMTDEKIQGSNMPLIFILTYVFSYMIGMVITNSVIHQNHFYSILVNEPGFGEQGSAIMTYIESFISKYGSNFRTFKHGAFHGTLVSVFLILPVIGINALFERRGAKYIFIHAGYWGISAALMGGIICEFS